MAEGCNNVTAIVPPYYLEYIRRVAPGLYTPRKLEAWLAAGAAKLVAARAASRNRAELSLPAQRDRRAGLWANALAHAVHNGTIKTANVVYFIDTVLASAKHRQITVIVLDDAPASITPPAGPRASAGVAVTDVIFEFFVKTW